MDPNLDSLSPLYCLLPLVRPVALAMAQQGRTTSGPPGALWVGLDSWCLLGASLGGLSICRPQKQSVSHLARIYQGPTKSLTLQTKCCAHPGKSSYLRDRAS